MRIKFFISALLLCSSFLFLITVFIHSQYKGVYSFGELKEIFSRHLEKLNLFTTSDYREITLTWDVEGNVGSYNLYWSNEPGVRKENGIKIENVYPPYKFRVAKNRTYYFVVTAVKGNMESAESEQIEFP